MTPLDPTARRAALGLTLLAAAAVGCQLKPAPPPAEPARAADDPAPPGDKGKPPAPRGAEREYHTVGRGDVAPTLVERGTVEATRSADVVCRVGAPATIKWVIDD